MSSIAAAREVRAEPPGRAGLLVARGVLRAVGVFGLLVGLGGGLLLATSGHLVDPIPYGVQIAAMLVGTVAAALYWLVRRPDSRLGYSLLALALATAVISLQGASQPLIHSVGVAADSAVFLLVYYVVFTFPDGRLVGRLETAVLGAWTLYFLTAIVPWLFFSPVIAGGAPLAACNDACPTNALMIADRPTIADPFGKDMSYGTIAIASATLGCLLYRLATATRPRRRALLPVYIPAVTLTVPVLIFHGAVTRHLDLDPTTISITRWSLTFGWIALPYGFLLSIAQATLFAGVALKTIVGRLDREEDTAHLRDLVAEALDDPSLELAFEIDRRSESFVDSRGDLIDPTRLGPGQSATALERHGETIAYIVHDAALDSDPELVQAAGQAVLLALESGRLEAELQSRTAELRTSRRRIAAASEAERRKIERDLHDGAQQRLMSIQIKLALARERVDDPELASELDEIGEDATAAVDDLRALAHGIYPTVLRERGLGDGFRSLARNAPIHIDVVDAGIGRCAPAVEAAVYFCSLEAIQNAMKHAGPGARVAVTLERRGNDIQFAVADDGAGFDPAERSDGIGLQSMRDRIDALGGELELSSAPGAGTRIRGTVPD